MRRRRRLLAGEEGDSLVEVTVSLLLLMVLALMVIPGFVGQLPKSVFANTDQAAARVADSATSNQSVETAMNATQGAVAAATGAGGSTQQRCQAFVDGLRGQFASQGPETIVRLDLVMDRSAGSRPERTLWWDPDSGGVSGDWTQVCTDLAAAVTSGRSIDQVPYRVTATSCSRTGQDVQQCVTAGGKIRSEVTALAK